MINMSFQPNWLLSFAPGSLQKRFVSWGVVVLFVLLPNAFLQGQQVAPQEGESLQVTIDSTWGTIPEEDQTPLAVAYRESVEALRKDVKAVWEFVIHFHTDMKLESSEKLKLWLELQAKSRASSMEYRKATIALYSSNPVKYEKLGHLLFAILKNESEADRLEGLDEISRALVDNRYPEPTLLGIASFTAYANNDFYRAKELIELVLARGGPGQLPPQVAMELNATITEWERELELRKKEAEADDLPRVKITTTKGVMIVELFENEAPEAVNSFIYLVENRFYDSRPFFRVLKHLMAQTGCERGDGTGTAGYTIRGEMKEPNARLHYRGSLAVALGSDPASGLTDYDSGSGQFYMTMMPGAQLNREYCVFGRIIEGIECLGEIQRLDLSTKEGKKESEGISPDMMVKVEVIRKRDHPYRPTPVTGSLPFR